MNNEPKRLNNLNPSSAIRFKTQYLIVALATIVLATGIGFLYSHKHAMSLNYSYHALSKATYTNKGKVAGANSVGVKFSQPSEFQGVASQTPAYDAYAQKVGNITIGGSFVTSASMAASDIQKEIATQKAAFAKGPTTDTNPPISQGLIRLIQVWLPQGTTAHITGSSALITPNITSNAWLLTFDATSTDKSVSQPLKGEIVFALGKKGEYIYVIYATAHNWANNSSIWQQSINSLQLDQFQG